MGQLYEKRLTKDLKKIQDSLAEIGSDVEVALNQAVESLLTGNHQLAYETVLGDRSINRAVKNLDRMCMGFIARHIPTAGHLRFITSSMRLAILLERIGDYSSTIARESVQLPKAPTGTMAKDLELMANDAKQALSLSVKAFTEENLGLAESTMTIADNVSSTFDRVIEDLSEDKVLKRKHLFNLLFAFNMLYRVSAQAKNICQETIYATTGEGKPAKVYKILFVDEDNTSLSVIAEAIARSKFGAIGVFESAGKKPAKEFHKGTVECLEEHDRPAQGDAPNALSKVSHQAGEFNIIVSLQGPVSDYVKEIPFHSVALEWEVGKPPSVSTSAEDMEETYRSISTQLNDIMVQLYGEKALESN